MFRVGRDVEKSVPGVGKEERDRTSANQQETAILARAVIQRTVETSLPCTKLHGVKSL